jgi:NAD(P)-dependent dehydrogenase (short-subunit alcohol dehydrogenase family)
VEHRLPQATAAILAEAGADVAVCTGHGGAAAQRRAEAAAMAVQQYHRQSRAYAIDVSSPTAVQTAIDDLVAAWGHLDILVNGLDLPFARPFVDNTTSEWQRLCAHLLYGTMHCVQAAGRAMLQQGQGRIITYVSMLGARGVAHCAAYSMIQAALVQLTQSLAVEWGRRGVTVNAIGSGWTQGSAFLPAAEDDLQRLLRYIPNHRLTEPDDLTALTVYLASDVGGNITGQVMFIEGGVMSHP